MKETFEGIIDRFENNMVVVEIDGQTKDYSRSLFPDAAKPGDVIRIDGKKITLLPEATTCRRQEIEKLMDELWED